MTRLKRH